MARKRKAVDTGSTRKQPARNCRQSFSADVAAEPSEVGKARSVMASGNPRPKRNPRRAAKDRWEEEKLMTSDKSQLINLDLVKLLALPEAWNCLEEAEKEEILSLLPSDVHPNHHPSPDDPDAKIPPLPESFLRYSNHWRDGVRQFQVDLQNGRYDPVWLRDADQAVKQRCAGQFDNFKEREFEEFWGQKQRMDKTLIAGQSSQVKLSTLIAQGLIRKGDVWKYSRVFSKGPQRTLVEKEARIIEINGFRLTFTVPPGQRVFLKTTSDSDTRDSGTTSNIVANPATPPLSPPDDPPEAEIPENLDTESTTEAGSSNKRDADAQLEAKVTKRPRGRPRKHKPDPSRGEVCNVVVEVTNPQPTAEITSPSPETKNDEESTAKSDNDAPIVADTSPAVLDVSNESSPQPVLPAENDKKTDEIIISDIHGPTALSSRILEVDGRIKEVPNGNAWKEFRAFRNNQDMGSLWEVRQAWYLRST